MSGEAKHAQQSHIHHYIPRFYTNKWTVDGKLVEFSRPYRNLVAARKSPKAVGFSHNLYTLPALKPEYQTILEDGFFRVADQLASNALGRLLEFPLEMLKDDHQIALTRLILSFLHRTPDRVAKLYAALMAEVDKRLAQLAREYEMGIGPELPAGVTADQALESLRANAAGWRWGDLLKQSVDSEFLGNKLLQMQWTARRLRHSDYPLLTSDKPVVMSNGLNKPDSHLALAASPTVVLLLTNNTETRRKIFSVSDSRFAAIFNDRVARSAVSYVYATSEAQKDFIDRRLRR